MTAAILSRDGKYRYSLTRDHPGMWTPPRGAPMHVAWIMLNPSTADATVDDPTIRKVMGFTRKLCLDLPFVVVVVNLYAFRSTNPEGLFHPRDCVGPLNDQHIEGAISSADRLVFAWGTNKAPLKEKRVDFVVDAAKRARKEALCLGVTLDGSPRHPLMLSYAQRFTAWQRSA